MYGLTRLPLKLVSGLQLYYCVNSQFRTSETQLSSSHISKTITTLCFWYHSNGTRNYWTERAHQTSQFILVSYLLTPFLGEDKVTIIHSINPISTQPVCPLTKQNFLHKYKTKKKGSSCRKITVPELWNSYIWSLINLDEFADTWF